MAKYSALVLEHFYRPQRVGRLALGAGVGVAETGNIERGGVVFYVKQHAGVIEDITYLVQGSVARTASCSWIATRWTGESIEKAQKDDFSTLIFSLALPETSHSDAIYVMDTFQKALAAALA